MIPTEVVCVRIVLGIICRKTVKALMEYSVGTVLIARNIFSANIAIMPVFRALRLR